MLSGIYLVLGIYSISYEVADETSFQLSANTANEIQAGQIARSGISLAMENMGTDSLVHTYSDISAEVMCGSVVYSASQIGLPLSQSEITSTGTFNDKTVVVKAVFVYYNNRWRIDRLYIPPTA
ncbi:MAG: hypothetical protein Q8L88_16555 [Bacteroidota bacterium]|nr:hypothetical protein [Bacteroidota bacterium]